VRLGEQHAAGMGGGLLAEAVEDHEKRVRSISRGGKGAHAVSPKLI
jgi:hypothetical protein